jgi:hypothetical protein
MTALRVRCWGVRRSALCSDYLLEERREVSAETGLPRRGESIPDLGWVAGHRTSHGSARDMSSVMACKVRVDIEVDSGGGETTCVAVWEIRRTMVSR